MGDVSEMISIEDFVSLSDAEIKSVHNFMHEHVVLMGCNRDFVITTESNAIKNSVIIECKTCGDKKDITDWDSA